MRKRKCDQCGEPFTPRSKAHKRCSPECSRAERMLACARLNERKRNGEVLDRRRGVDIVCETCGISYAAFRSGFSFTDARRDFITDDPNRKTGRRRHGRRHGVLGKMREIKQLAWNAHIAECANAKKGAA